MWVKFDTMGEAYKTLYSNRALRQKLHSESNFFFLRPMLHVDITAPHPVWFASQPNVCEFTAQSVQPALV
jgi:hypothetical protein